MDFNGFYFSIINIYAPNVAAKCGEFFCKLSTAVSDCSEDRILILDRDFNCAVDHTLNRNHEEPHPKSAKVLEGLLTCHDLVDVRREQFPREKQYTWLRTSSDSLSGARLDQLYVRRTHRRLYCRSCITPTDRHFICFLPFATKFFAFFPLGVQ